MSLRGFKTAEDVGLKLPEPKVHVIEVYMNDEQDAKYTSYVAQIEAALESTSTSDKAKILGLLGWRSSRCTRTSMKATTGRAQPQPT